VPQVKAPLIQNETGYDGRSVNAIVKWVFRELDLDGNGVMVKVKLHKGCHAYQGRFYSHGARHIGYVYKEAYRGAGYGEYVAVRPSVPPGISSLLVCRIGTESVYPCDTHVYDRRDSPGTWEVADWKEALVAITAHEATHLRQFRSVERKGGRFNEVQTEWAAFRLWRNWCRKNGRTTD
jgi:hypothetical protein